MSRTRRLTRMALLAAMALGLYVLEAQLPAPIPVPGVKLGLANAVTLAAMALLGRREAGAVLLVRLALGSLFSGSLSALLFSAAGGILAWAVMALTLSSLGREKLWAVSVLGALGHNAGQLAAAVAVTGTPAILWYAPALVASGIATGAFTGLATQYTLRKMDKTR